MIKLKETNTDSDVIMMKDMKPYDIGVIEDETSDDNGCMVMRSSSSTPEVFNLTHTREDNCWTIVIPNIKIKLLPKGTEITLVVV